MLNIGLGHYLTLAAIIFSIGVAGIFLNRKNIIVILMSIELILLAVNINLVGFSAHLGDLLGQPSSTASQLAVQPDNPQGFFESRQLVDLNNELLGWIARDWSTPPCSLHAGTSLLLFLAWRLDVVNSSIGLCSVIGLIKIRVYALHIPLIYTFFYVGFPLLSHCANRWRWPHRFMPAMASA